jgi:hypothetical protein
MLKLGWGRFLLADDGETIMAGLLIRQIDLGGSAF